MKLLFFSATTKIHNNIWAPSSEFVSSSIPPWQILTAHAQPFRGARDLAFCLKVPLDSLLVWASSEGSGETAQMRRLAWTFAARIGYKYQIRLTRSICHSHIGTDSGMGNHFEADWIHIHPSWVKVEDSRRLEYFLSGCLPDLICFSLNICETYMATHFLPIPDPH